MRDLRIVFMGTPEFAVAGLQKLLEEKYKVVGVITAPDRPAGRGQKLNESAVKQFAVSLELKVLQPTNLKDPAFLEELRSLNANLQIVVAFRMLPEAVWKMPEYGTFNLHASLLPDYRGAAPINWAIINGETKTGVTTFFIDEKIDTGAIVLQKETEIKPHENAGSLHDRLMHLGSELILETVEQIEAGTAKTQKQTDDKELSTAYKLNRDNTRINWDKPAKAIYNLIRGLSPYPVAWTLFTNGDAKEQQLKIYKASLEETGTQNSEHIGKLIVNGDKLYIPLKNARLQLEEIQLPGKRKMPVKDLLNGFSFHEKAKVI
ncbi:MULTISPECIES: methionyl-tRNA formyltransferase [unclassified Leeuwenhoekiella]|uniref:methionyl-tRNA formyltransferase n=1 Tax=unclassified Leeuwenhoekiella TaxID=2615029 RepID=UPI000C4EC26E|nr:MULTISPECIES: methionyl-tRNA formyltransferase [unclassified Leeuwenhoekiella]MAW93704.1 methionyl-tRNA formyltransferase [Leeuwenhoekiella sp.]MBA83072.1 methionyl-tRNA formyltransferase [Leeuwenhoekiella sp.]|tara:strand:- start:43621 stop:44577 length:957 start_codon:yes stop_codon:yes gene_type:complete